jgi:hypothetical protein
MVQITPFTYHPLTSLNDKAILMPTAALQSDITDEIQRYMHGRELPTHVYMLEVWRAFAFYLPAARLAEDQYTGNQRDEYPYDRLDAWYA